MKLKTMLVTALGLALLHQAAIAQKTPHLLSTFHIASSGGWDYIAVQPGSNNLYVSHGTQVNILNKNTGDSLGVIPNTTGVHGIAFVTGMNKGYTSNGRLNNCTVFDLKTFNILGQVATGTNPDAIFYDPYSKKVITCNGRSSDLSIIDPATDKVVATVPLGGKPETAVSDEAGKIFVNIEDKNEIAVVNAKTWTVDSRWALAPGTGPSGLAIDVKNKRLFSGCSDSKLMVVMNAENGSIVEKIPIGQGCDGTGFDGKMNLAYSSNGEGTLTVVKEDSKDKFSLVANVPTKTRARTIAVDESTHKIYLPTAEFEAQQAGQTGRPPMVPGTFQVLVFGY